ncbi:MAG: adenosylcobinamide amidohydrolase [Pseudomonadota bacterium]
MKSITRLVFRSSVLFLLLVPAVLIVPAVSAGPGAATDPAGRELHFTSTPRRVVSLVPTASEILFALGRRDVVVGITRHDARLPGGYEKTIVGGYFSPSRAAIAALDPDLIIAAPHQRQALPATNAAVLVFDARSLADADANITMLGKIFQREKEAGEILARNRAAMDLIRKKTDRVPGKNRPRVMRLMGREEIMTPGDDSFQNELIAAAGGVPPKLGKTGDIMAVTLEEWRSFNPQALYGCGDDLRALGGLLQRPGWRDVDAVRDGRLFSLPCDLTCRAATHTGYFATWLASLIQGDEFSAPGNNVRAEKIIGERPVEVDLPYVKKARIVLSHINDFENKTLLLDFTAPQTAVSTLEGQRHGLLSVGNHYSPPPAWAAEHRQGLASTREHLLKVLHRPAETTSLLFTGADLDNLSAQTVSFRDMKVAALVTAGVGSNAVRMSRDSGDYYEPGTINIIILTNMALTPRAMTRAVISATEAKTAALWDLDVRSSFTPLVNPATGTGTDNIIVVGGEGTTIDNAGGHCKMGELIARAVYQGVQEAARKQNGLTQGRSIFDRLDERRISLSSLASDLDCDCLASDGAGAALVEELLLEPKYAGFLEAALALSDAHEQKNMADLTAFHHWGLALAEEIAGKKLSPLEKPRFKQDIPEVVREALGYLFAGTLARERK